jgi:hypothetical protein
MVKGIGGWIKAHTPIGRSKSEGSVEPRASVKIDEARRKVTRQPEAINKRSVSTAAPRPRKAPPKPSERPPSPPHSNDAAQITKRRTPPKPSEPPPTPPLTAAPKTVAEPKRTLVAQAETPLTEIDHMLEDLAEPRLRPAPLSPEMKLKRMLLEAQLDEHRHVAKAEKSLVASPKVVAQSEGTLVVNAERESAVETASKDINSLGSLPKERGMHEQKKLILRPLPRRERSRPTPSPEQRGPVGRKRPDNSAPKVPEK